MVTVPYPPESSTTTSPAGNVWAIAAAKLRHGAARVQGLASLPAAAETNVRWARAAALCTAAGARPEANEPAANAAPPTASRTMATAISRERETRMATLPSLQLQVVHTLTAFA